MPEYLASLRRYLERQFRKLLQEHRGVIGLSISATPREGYIEVMVYFYPFLFTMGHSADDPAVTNRLLEQAEECLPEVIGKAEDLADQVTDKLEAEGHQVIIYVRRG